MPQPPGGHRLATAFAAKVWHVETDCLFCKIVAKEIPATIVYETERTLAFRDINPQAPTHVLVIPKGHYRDAAALAAADDGLADEVIKTAHAVAVQEGVHESGYRLVFNTGPGAGQTVFHVHAHVLGGRDLGWPPG
ncbi:histidine triad nucleotide-binding protein [Thermostaphylospora chromogena]|uniref:Histidine triad (HIT) family protein n=1 Tax=Thermostaphylospora chromogena TaxID=35622 RepID=A0A1H1FP02_9ACTN|nr:histidine triad nucleotide-binding protein [Thermostaphylospora chromogena]SDR02647.1 histidine triad (HIT) family protein [Thermostaphylospora chromogena]